MGTYMRQKVNDATNNQEDLKSDEESQSKPTRIYPKEKYSQNPLRKKPDSFTMSDLEDDLQIVEADQSSMTDVNPQLESSMSTLSQTTSNENQKTSIQINKEINQIINAVTSSQSSASENNDVNKSLTSPLLLQANDFTKLQKQKLLYELQNKKEKEAEEILAKTPQPLDTPEQITEKLAKKVKGISNTIQKSIDTLDETWSNIGLHKKELAKVTQQKQSLQLKMKVNQMNNSVSSNASNSSIIKKLNSKLDNLFLQAIENYDLVFELNSQLRELGQPQIQQMHQVIQKAASLEAEEIDEQVKGQFLFKLVKEIRRSVESQKKLRLNKNQQRQIEQKIKKRMPSLSPSPSPSPEKTKQSDPVIHKQQSAPKRIPSPNKNNQDLEEVISPMNQGYGVSVSYRKTQPNNFSYNSRSKQQQQQVKQDEYVSIMAQSNSSRNKNKPNHFKAKTTNTKKVAHDDVLLNEEETWFSNENPGVDQDVWY